MKNKQTEKGEIVRKIVNQNYLEFTKNQIQKLKKEMADYVENEKLFRIFINKFIKGYSKEVKEKFGIQIRNY